jgi:serine protease Do
MEQQYSYSNHPSDRWRGRTSILAVLGLLLVALAGVAGAQAYRSTFAATAAEDVDSRIATGAPLPAPAGTASAEALSQSFSSVAKAVGPAVVHLNVVQEVKRPASQRFFGFGFPEDRGGSTVPQRGAGSGVIVNGNGFILTNNHVVGKATAIEVKLADGRRLKGTVVGTDPQTDLAVVKVDASGLPTASLGDSNVIQQGDWVVAVGSPFGLEQTITAGIVSATGRRLTASPYDAFIQTDASINPGNSGGPLVNLRGEVIGINTLIFSESGGNQGIGFAIPANTARKIYEQLATGNHKVVRGYFGVNVRDLEPALAQSLNVPETTKGAVVADVADSESPAARAGLRSGDIITAIDSDPVASALELTNKVADIAPGATVRVDYLRDGQPSQASVTVTERPANAGLNNQDDDEGDGGAEARPSKLGVGVRDVTPEIAEQLRLKVPNGAVVAEIDPTGAAASAGVRRGDVIPRVGRTPVASAADLTEALQGVESCSEVVLQVERSGQLAFVTVRVE